MNQSLFYAYIQRFFGPIVTGLINTLNGTTNPVTYLYRTMLTRTFSVTGKWESITSVNSRVMADVVAMNSSLPLKARDSLSRVSGDIPKMGFKMVLDERQITDIQTLQAINATGANAQEQQLLAAIFEDTPRLNSGVDERLEAMLLRGLSSGVALVDDGENVGTGVRIDYGYPTANKFGVSVPWSNASTAKPFDDIQRVLDKAGVDGTTITVLMLDRPTFLNLAKTQQTKDLFAFGQGFVGSTVPAPSLSQLNPVIQDRYGFVFQIIDRSVVYEKDGAQTSYKPWQAGSVIFLQSADNVGALVYARLAEQGAPVAAVVYQLADDFKLFSKYSKNDPLMEFSSVQARVVPVIANTARIYQIDTTTIQA